MESIKLTIVIPAFNEERSLGALLERILKVEFDSKVKLEILLIDDASTDTTPEIAIQFADAGVLYVRQSSNSGKGAAVRRGIELATGNYLLVQDADLEYFPEDIPDLIKAGLENVGAVVYGSRQIGASNLLGLRRILRIWPGQSILSYIFNFILSMWLFALRGEWITDTLTGYKLYPRTIFQDWLPETKGFETDHEITSHILNLGVPIVEVGINYSPRSVEEGKKIRARDGIIAILTFWRYRK